MKAWGDADPRGALLAALAPYREHRPTVCIDSIGIGYYMGQHVRDDGWLVLDVNVGRPAVDKRRFSNWKAELFWGLRDVFTEGDIEIPADAKLISQLSSLRYDYNSRGLVQIESKVAMARRGVRSPDRAEALMLAFASSNRLQLKRGAISSEILL
jgi:phage FluMu gp28-like protein